MRAALRDPPPARRETVARPCSRNAWTIRTSMRVRPAGGAPSSRKKSERTRPGASRGTISTRQPSFAWTTAATTSLFQAGGGIAATAASTPGRLAFAFRATAAPLPAAPSSCSRRAPLASMAVLLPRAPHESPDTRERADEAPRDGEVVRPLARGRIGQLRKRLAPVGATSRREPRLERSDRLPPTAGPR